MRLVDSGQEIIIAVSLDELRLLKASVGEALEAVDDWEFSTRLGAEPAEARALRADIRDLLAQVATPD